MKIGKFGRFLCGAAMCLSAVGGFAPAARACGGLVAPINASVGMDAQRAFLSLQNGNTEMVVQIYVPQTTSNYGVLLPVPVQPTIDKTPVDSGELDMLDQATQPQITVDVPSSGGGFGCGSAAPAGGAGGKNPNGVVIGQTVAVGPVTAVSLSASTPAMLNSWLSTNGFVLSAAAQAVVNQYATPGEWFVAFMPNGTGVGSSLPSSIGVHVTLSGDHRDYAMRMAGVGAAGSLAITAFVAAPTAVGPAAPYQALTLTDLNTTTLQNADYRTAVASAVAAHNNQAFVVEGEFPAAQVLSGQLLAFANTGQTLTRLSTVVSTTALTMDVAFNGPAPATVPNTLMIGAQGMSASSGGRPGAALPGGLLLLALSFLWVRRLARTPRKARWSPTALALAPSRG